jgi:hypothetical protein
MSGVGRRTLSPATFDIAEADVTRLVRNLPWQLTFTSTGTLPSTEKLRTVYFERFAE